MGYRGLRQPLLFLTLVIVAAAQSCLKSKETGLPADVVRVIQLTGHNRVELIKALSRFIESDDTAKRNALYFLISNMERHYAVEYEPIDSATNALRFDPLQYDDYQSVLIAWDSLSALPGGLMYSASRYTLDRDTIRSELLLNTIELSLSSKKHPWSKHLPDSIFLRYVLPYRVANEDLEDWRPLLYQFFSESILNPSYTSTDEVANAINLLIDSHIISDNRLIKNANIALPSEVLKHRRASPRDLAIFRVMALRSAGIAATLDYAPWITDSLNSIWFVTYYNEQGNWQPLLPREFEENLLKDASRVPKIYRRIYHTVDSSLFALKDLKKTTPPFLGHFHYLDVTKYYLPVRNVSFRGQCPDHLIYLAVFNGRSWKPVDWAFCHGDSAMFFNVGRDVDVRFAWLEELGDYHKINLIGSKTVAD